MFNMSNVRQAVIFSSASRYLLRLIGLISTMVIARLLTPGEIGTFAIASAIVMIMSEFRLLGAGAYIVREKELTESKVASALGLTVLISWGLGLIVFFSASLVAEFYGIPDVENIFRILSISFFLAPYISIPTAVLQRVYQFKTLFIIKVFATVVGLLSTVSLILLDFSFYALALGHTLIIGVEFILIALFWPENTPWRPQFRGLKPVASVGIYSSMANLLKKATVTVPDMVIGKMGTITQVGIFSRGLGLAEFLSQSLMMGINPVALPYLSETKRTGGDISWAYIRASVLLGGLVWPVLAVASMASLPVIRLFFGGQWDEAAPLATWLAVWAMLRSTHWLSNSVLLASGKEKIMVAKELIVFIVFFISIILAFPYGLESIAIAFVLASVWDLLVSSMVLKKTINLGFVQFLRAWWPNLAVSGVCWFVTYLISQVVSFESDNYWLPILTIGLVMPPVWILSLKIFSHPLYIELSGVLKSILGKFVSK